MEGAVSGLIHSTYTRLMLHHWPEGAFKELGVICERLMEGGYHIQLYNLFATSYNMGKVTLECMDIILSYNLISSTIGIPSHGEKWFKDMDLDIENYKQFLKPHARDDP